MQWTMTLAARTQMVWDLGWRLGPAGDPGKADLKRMGMSGYWMRPF